MSEARMSVRGSACLLQRIIVITASCLSLVAFNLRRTEPDASYASSTFTKRLTRLLYANIIIISIKTWQ